MDPAKTETREGNLLFAVAKSEVTKEKKGGPEEKHEEEERSYTDGDTTTTPVMEIDGTTIDEEGSVCDLGFTLSVETCDSEREEKNIRANISVGRFARRVVLSDGDEDSLEDTTLEVFAENDAAKEMRTVCDGESVPFSLEQETRQ